MGGGEYKVLSKNVTRDVSQLEKKLISEADFGSITFKCNRLHYNYFAIFMITLHYDYINFQM
jgi:hypothetical protein